nr:hypothetical protein [Tanacetum cinerariifolium]
MADNRTMAELLQAPTEGYEDAISKSKVHQSRAKAVVAKVSTSSSTPTISSEVAELKDMVRALLLDKKNQSLAPVSSPIPAPVKAVEPNCVTCGGTHSYQNCPATSGNDYRDNIQLGIAYQGPTIPTPSKQGTELTKDQVQTSSSQSTAPVQLPVAQSEIQTLISKPVVAPVSAPMPNVKSSIPYPSRRDNERRHDQANKQIKKFYEIFKDVSFEISFTDALILMPKFASTLKALIGNKEKLSEMARTPMNEHCLTVILNKLPRKLRDPGKFLVPSLSLPELTSTCMTLELANHSVSIPIGIAKDVSFKVGVFRFLADFVVVDFEPDPQVPLILERCFLKTGRALINVHKGELTLRIVKAITYNLDQTEVLGFSDVTTSGNPTPHDDPIVFTTSPTLTPFGDSDFLLFEETDDFLGLEDDPNSPEPLPLLPNHEQYLPSFKKELKVCEAKTIKFFVDEPPEGINPEFCTHKILMEEDYKPAVQHQRRDNPKIHDVIKKEVEKLLDAGLIYPISDSPWVSPVDCVPKKGGFTVVENEENELILTRLVTRWRDYSDCEVFRALSFSITRASHPQLHLGNLKTDSQEKSKNKAKNDKTKQRVEKIRKDKVIRSRKSKVKARDEIGELREIFGHMLGAAGVQIPENNLDNLHSSREEDGTSKTVDPQDLLGLGVSLSRAVGSLRGTSAVVVILVKGHAFPTIVKVRLVEGCDPLALVDGFTPVEGNAGLLETRFDVKAVFVIVFPKDVTGSVNLTFLVLFIGVTATNLSLKLLMQGQNNISVKSGCSKRIHTLDGESPHRPIYYPSVYPP